MVNNSAIKKEVVIGDCRKGYIYALCEPLSDVVRYVGKTERRFLRRYNEHLFHTKKSQQHLPVNRWINKRKSHGKTVAYKLLETVNGDDCSEREKFWISHYRSLGSNLLNLTDGGEGTLGHKVSQETKEKISSKLRKGSMFNCFVCQSEFWRKPRDIKAGNNKFCSKSCYQAWQVGRPKENSKQIMGVEGRKAAAAAKRSRTHCRNGHEFTKKNTYINPRGARVCKTCQRVAVDAYTSRNR